MAEKNLSVVYLKSIVFKSERNSFKMFCNLQLTDDIFFLYNNLLATKYEVCFLRKI